MQLTRTKIHAIAILKTALSIPDISGSVMARVPNGITGEWCRLLLSARRTGESKMGGSTANGPLRSGELAPVVNKYKFFAGKNKSRLEVTGYVQCTQLLGLTWYSDEVHTGC
jgi:hypothetical protein